MARAFSYNKSTIQEFQKQLRVRRNALPVLMRKETALRQVIANRKPELKRLKDDFQKQMDHMNSFASIWSDLPSVLRVDRIEDQTVNVAGSKVKRLQKVHFKDLNINPLYEPAWMPAAVEMLMHLIENELKVDYLEKEISHLELARKKTTQKVNLYEKVQIPEYEEGIRKVKRFLEDKENIATAAKKIAKNRKSMVG